MTDPIESLVRQALQVQADRAVDPEQVRSALPARSVQRATQHRSGLVAVGAVLAVATAVAVPTLVTRLDGAAGSGTGATGVAGAEPTASRSAGTPQVVPEVTLRYRPTWLPDGLVERGRQAPIADDGQAGGPVRIWTRNPVGSSGEPGKARVELYIMDKTSLADDGTPVTVNGHPGRVVSTDGVKAYVAWQPDPETVLMINQRDLGLTTVDLVRIAESVRADSAALTVPLRIGWLPQGMRLTSADTTGNSATAWRSRVSGQEQQPAESKVPGDKQPGPNAKTGSAVPASDGTDPRKAAEKRQGSGQRSIEVSVGTLAISPPGTGTPGTVNGLAARSFTKAEADQDGGETAVIAVDLGDGRTLTVQGFGAWSPAELIKVAENVEVTQVPDLSWLGTR